MAVDVSVPLWAWCVGLVRQYYGYLRLGALIASIFVLFLPSPVNSLHFNSSLPSPSFSPIFPASPLTILKKSLPA